MSSNEDIQKKIDELEAEMARTQKNKATNYHLGTLKAKIAKLKSELVNGPGGKSAGTKNAERGFDVTKSGDTRIGLVGFPSVGKSTLLTTLTGTRSEAAAYEFTTLTCIPGTMKYKGARIQVLDLPVRNRAITGSNISWSTVPHSYAVLYSRMYSFNIGYYRGRRRWTWSWTTSH